MQSTKETKKTKRKVVIMSVSLPADLAEQADAKARQNYQSRSEYIKNLIFLDTQLITVNMQNQN